MSAPQPHDTSDIVIAATLWLMYRYQQTGSRKLARMIEQHLAWMHDRASSPRLADACRRLSFEWRAVAADGCAVSPHPVLH